MRTHNKQRSIKTGSTIELFNKKGGFSPPFFIFSMLVVGASGIAAQVLILRELLISFLGNELIIGIILGNWVILEAAGVFLTGKYSDRIKNKAGLFIVLEIIFSLALPVSIYYCRTFKGLLGMTLGQTAGLPVIFGVSLLANSALSFCHGGLFSCGCKIYSSLKKEAAGVIGSIYTWETTGTIIGGIILTYCLIPYLNSFNIAFIVSAINLVIALWLSGHSINKKLKFIFLPVTLLILCLFLALPSDNLQRISIEKEWYPAKVLDYKNSVYGNLAVTKSEEQYTFFYNGLPLVTAPYPDITFVEEFGNLPLLFHPQPQNILVISSGAGGLINEILKHPVKRIDYVELDPLLIRMLKKYPTKLTEKELADPRVNIISNVDARFFVKTTSNKYDIVLIGLAQPADLSTNRFFTREFFLLVGSKLDKGGILAAHLPGSLTFISPQTRDLNFSVKNALEDAYRYVRIIPGDYNLFLASDSEGILNVTPGLISKKLIQQNIKTNLLISRYLDYRLDKQWVDWFKRATTGATGKLNKDLSPYALFQNEIIWNKQFSLRFAGFLEALGKIDLPKISILTCILTALGFFMLRKRQKSAARISLVYSIATTGFFAMLVNLLLVFSFQVTFGYLYHKIGLLISIFMAGAALGSLLITKNLREIKRKTNFFLGIELLIMFFTLILSLVLTRWMGFSAIGFAAYLLLFLISGLLLGMEFPLAAFLFLVDEEAVGFTSGMIYSADLLGGWAAGMLGGVLFLPVLGLFNTCLLVVILKTSSLLLLIWSRFFSIES